MTSGGAADRGGVKKGDRVVGVNGKKLALGQKLVDLMPKGGYRAKVSLHVLRSAPSTVSSATGQAEGRKRNRPPELQGMGSLAGVRTSGGGLSHIERLVRGHETRTQRSL